METPKAKKVEILETHMIADDWGGAELVYAAGRQRRVGKLACIFILTQSNTDKTVSNWLKLNS